MFERFARSWELVKASAAVLNQDRQLLLFPLFSGLAMLLVVLSFALPVLGVLSLEGLSAAPRTAGRSLWVIGFAFYLTQYFIIFFFNAALVAAAQIRLDGGTPTIGAGLSIAFSRVGSIFAYALIAATVGTILRVLGRRAGWIGRLALGVIGTAWTLATALVVPVLVARDLGPIAAIGESARLLKKTWGENVIGSVGLSGAFALIHIAVMVCAALLIGLTVVTQQIALIVFAALVAVLAVILTTLVHSALSSIYTAALFRHATGSSPLPGFTPATLNNAFSPRA